MNRYRIVFFLFGLTFVPVLRPGEVSAQPAQRPDAWDEVAEALTQQRPQAAIEKLEAIRRRALDAGNYPEAVRAIAGKIETEAAIKADMGDLRVTRMIAEIARAPEEMRPVMRSIAAIWAWRFFQENRWQFAQRTQVVLEPLPDAAETDERRDDAEDSPRTEDPALASLRPGDMLSWDLPRILRFIDRLFQQSLEDTETLQKIAIGDYAPLIAPLSNTVELRPTLYDVLAHHAIEFYSVGEQAGVQPFDDFVLSADSPIFSARHDFLAWEPEARDDWTPLLRAVRLYQQLLRLHADDNNPSALLDIDLARLRFGHDHAVGEAKDARYRTALYRFDADHSLHPISTRALYEIARLAHDDGDFAEAHRIAVQARARFPRSDGAGSADDLIVHIERPESSISTARVWNAPWPTIEVKYRNIDKVHFRLVSFDFDAYLRSESHRPERLRDVDYRRLLDQRPVKAWSAELPATPDFKPRVESLPVPQDVARGSYLLLASFREDFVVDPTRPMIAEVWVSELALVVNYGFSRITGWVLDAATGEPHAGATIQPWQRHYPARAERLPAVRTDHDGQFEIPSPQAHLILLAEHDGDRLSSDTFGGGRPSEPHEGILSTTVFFTDRALYRPGQTIRFKGISYRYDQKSGEYAVLPDNDLEVVFSDSNRKEIERLRLRTNRLGSFSGSVTAPADRLTGMMLLQVPSGPRGGVAVRVEAYKRPRFSVEVAAPPAAAKLEGEVELKGTATAYTGAPVDGAAVQWRVVREVSFPPWWGSRWRDTPTRYGERQEIARGIAATDALGNFDIRFTARPDPKVSADSEPTFVYAVHAAVTDGTGETQVARREVRLGYTALVARMSADDWQTIANPVKLELTTQTHDAIGQAAEGTVKVHTLKQPDSVIRQSLPRDHRDFFYTRTDGPVAKEQDPGDPESWELGEVVHERPFRTDGAGNETLELQLPAGIYRAVLETQDRFGKAVSASLQLEVFDLSKRRWDANIAHRVRVEKTSIEPGETFRVLWASGYASATALIEIQCAGVVVRRIRTEPGRTLQVIEHEVDEHLRGGFTLRTLMVRENRMYSEIRRIDVPWTNKQLTLKWERFVSKLRPGEPETWTVVISGPDGEPAAAEMVASLYDASLDAFLPHYWRSALSGFRVEPSDHYRSLSSTSFQNRRQSLIEFRDSPRRFEARNRMHYPRLSWAPPEIHRLVSADERAADGTMMGKNAMAMDAVAEAKVTQMAVDSRLAEPPAADPNIDLSGVTARRNLEETAFFFPHAVAGDDGMIRLQFTMPEALTRWNFLGFAHDTELRSGLLRDSAITAKDLMVQPNPPRFLREGDEVEFTVKVINQSPTRLTGSVALSLAEGRSGDSVDEAFGNDAGPQAFDLPTGRSESFAWRIKVPDGFSLVIYRAIGSTGRLSDGEEGYLPVLPRRVLTTESLPLPIRGKQSKTFQWQRLADAEESDSLEHQSLTVQMTSNPAWYAVMALPYLMEFPHQCSEQVFNRLYAGALARHIAASDPRIERVFNQWRSTPALDSPLEQNEDLRSVLLEETPWVRQAASESQTRRDVGILFGNERTDIEVARALQQLTDQQLGDGLWPWFPGGRSDRYITLYIATGFGKLRHLGVGIEINPALRAIPPLDAWMAKEHRRMVDPRTLQLHGDRDAPSPLMPVIAFYLYGRSFFLRDMPVAAEHAAALKYFLDRSEKEWNRMSLQSQAHLAIALSRFGRGKTAAEMMASFKERAVVDEELGMHWPITRSVWWYYAPIETQCALIEAFDEVTGDAEAVEACKAWLLKQKQTQDWRTTKATAGAIYALLLRGKHMLASDELVNVSLGGVALTDELRPDQVQAGTGLYEKRVAGSEVRSEMSRIEVKKKDEGIAWGSVHWQYFEDIEKVTPYSETPLTLTKELYVKRPGDRGPQLERVEGNVRVGDELIVRLVLKTDRDLEYVHLRDHRGSGTEPINVRSGYRFRKGFAYYESTRDTASHFFIDYLPRGTYVFEYSSRVRLRGNYQTGIANIQCMYAPEFGGHSESIRLSVAD